MLKNKRIIVIFLMIMFIYLFTITACDGESMPEKYTRFITTDDKYKIDSETYTIVYDSETNIVYLVQNWNRFSGITVMWDENGNPMTWEKYSSNMKGK